MIPWGQVKLILGGVMKQVYVLLSKTGTVCSRVIHGLTGGTYTHASIALTADTDHFYSYARRVLNNPLRAGLVTENIHTFVFARYPESPCALYSIELSDEAYEKVKRRIDYYMQNYPRAKYNFIGAIALRMGIRIRREFRLVCSQFVALMLLESNEVKLPKDPYMMLPCDFQSINNIKKIYSGRLKDCRFPVVSVSS